MISDPSVQAMTLEQWVFEYQALARKEAEDQKYEHARTRLLFTGLRDLLIDLLGLSVLGPKTELERQEDVKKGNDPDAPKYVPASFLIGQPAVIARYLERAQERIEEEKALSDDAFDQFSQALLDRLSGRASSLDPKLWHLLEAPAKPVHHIPHFVKRAPGAHVITDEKEMKNG